MKRFQTKFDFGDLFFFHTKQESLPSAEIIRWRSNIALEQNKDTRENSKMISKFIVAFLEDLGMDLDIVHLLFFYDVSL